MIIAGAETEKEYEYDYAAYGYGQPAAQAPDSSSLALRLATDPGERGSPPALASGGACRTGPTGNAARPRAQSSARCWTSRAPLEPFASGR